MNRIMPDQRRVYGGPVEDPSPVPSAKPAYFYYSPRRDNARGQFVDGAGYHPKQASPPIQKAVTTSPSPTQRQSELGTFHQQPDGTIVMVQPTPVDPYERRVKCLKYVIFGSNVVLLIVGFSLLAFGAYLKADDRFRDLLSENFRQVTSKAIDPVLYVGTYLIIAIALGLIIVSFFGCCGAILDHTCLLTSYFILLMILFFLQVSVIVLALIKREKIEYDVGEALDYMVQHYYQGPGIVTNVMDQLQMTFRCCGNSGCADYSYLRLNVPRSCDVACDGCIHRMFRFFRDGFIVVGVAMMFVFIAEILAIGFSLYLSCFIRSHPTTRRRYFYYRPTSTPSKTSPPSGRPVEMASVASMVKKPL